MAGGCLWLDGLLQKVAFNQVLDDCIAKIELRNADNTRTPQVGSKPVAPV